jgi:hypothetical protein
MTLCIAWKNGNNINFSSDSRLSDTGNGKADIGIKVMDIPVKVQMPVQSETGIESTAYDYHIGLCYCGDTIVAHIIKETVTEVLQRLQYIPGHTDFSMNGICKLISRFVEDTADKLQAGMGWNDIDVDFLIGGFCPSNKCVKVYKISLSNNKNAYRAIVDEVLKKNNDLIVLGSGTTKANEIIAKKNINPGNKLLKVLRDVCKDNSVPSVGGNIQYGHFVNGSFEIKGVADYEIDANSDLEYIYTYRGTVLYKNKHKMNDDDFHISCTFIMPFEDEIELHWKSKGI